MLLLPVIIFCFAPGVLSLDGSIRSVSLYSASSPVMQPLHPFKLRVAVASVVRLCPSLSVRCSSVGHASFMYGRIARSHKRNIAMVQYIPLNKQNVEIER